MTTQRPTLSAWTAADARDPSVRTRLLEWARRTGTPLELHVATDPLGVQSRRAAHRLRSGADGPLLVLRNAARASRGALEARLLSMGSPAIYELDDGLPWDDGRLPDLGAWWKVPFRRDRLAARAARAADRVIVGNAVLAEWAADHCADVRIIPTCVDPADYDAKEGYDVGATPQILWMGSAATLFELTRISPALAEVHRRTGARVTVVGSPGPLPPALSGFSTLVPWSVAEQRRAPARADVGVMPLTDGVYQRAKCGYKLLQYAAAGLPAVAAPVGVNAGMLGAGLGVPATTEPDWVDQLVAVLSADPRTRREMGATARSAVAAWTYAAWEPAWLDAVRATGTDGD